MGTILRLGDDVWLLSSPSRPFHLVYRGLTRPYPLLVQVVTSSPPHSSQATMCLVDDGQVVVFSFSVGHAEFANRLPPGLVVAVRVEINHWRCQWKKDIKNISLVLAQHRRETKL